MITQLYSISVIKMITQHMVKGGVKMNEKAQLLDDFWKGSGKKKTYLAEKINVSRPRLNYIFEHPDSATVGQADGLCRELNIKKVDRDFIFIP